MPHYARERILLRQRGLEWMLAPVSGLIAVWVRRRERQILASGVPLSAAQARVACALGVIRVERVRLVYTTPLPLPLPGVVRCAAQRAGLISPHIAGMTLGYGIALRGDCLGDTRLLAHELAHVAQHERMDLNGFLRQYVRECVLPGYPRGALEAEARAAEAKFS